MRPHRLRLQAFGAFADEVTLDLDTLGEQGLVLLTGDTGSGKTTLLDALGFALYGTVVGERSKAKDLRSHHAAAGVEPWVELEFTARGRRMRVRRSPAWSRPGRASEVNATGNLWESVDGEWLHTSSKLQEIGHELSMLLGMSAEQFHSVVVLPQGRFATFLQASSNEREALLKKLFMVERFEFVQEWLLVRARAAEESLASASGRSDGLAARVAQVEGIEVPEDQPLGGWATNLLAGAAVTSQDAQAALATARQAREAASVEVSLAQDLRRRQQLRRVVESQLQELQAAVPVIDVQRAAVLLAERARPVLQVLQASREAAHEVASATAWCEGLDAKVGAVGLASATPLADVAGANATLVKALDGALQRSGRLTALTDVASGVAAARAEAVVAAGSAETAEFRAMALETRLATLPADLTSTGVQLDRARAAAAALPELRRQVVDEEAAVNRRADHDQQISMIAEHEGLLIDAQAVVSREASLEQELRIRRIDAVASELAAYLEAGTPCPTCGSLDHPEPAEVWADEVTREQERLATARLESARAEQGRVHAALSGARARRDALAEQMLAAEQYLNVGADGAAGAAGAVGAAGAAGAAAGGLDGQGAADRLEALIPLAASLERLERAERTLRQEQTQLMVELAASRTELVAFREAQSSASRRAKAGEARLSAEIGEWTLAEAVQVTQTLIDVAAEAINGLLALEESRRVRQRAKTALAAVLRDQGFTDAADAQAGALTEVELQAAGRSVINHDAALSGATIRLADPDLAIDIEPAADVESARDRAEESHKLESAATADSALADKRLQELSALAPELSSAVAALAPLRDDAQLLRELADVAAGRGANKLRMPLASFVLAARLEEVAQAASVRLELMSGGRYTLVHSDTGRDGRLRAGLALQVEDGWTGQRRDTATLSGGETFMAALALALGLADVVTAETGGASIDALFVDEGFGSLDPDTLDKVMDVLDSLRSGGRLVGVVSHVAEMRERIPAQVHVAKGVNGSSLSTTV